MNAILAGDRPALVAAIVDAIKRGGLFAVDVDVVPTKIVRGEHAIQSLTVVCHEPQ